MKVILIRHGETQHNRDHIIQGHYDSELNEFGRAQAAKVGLKLREIEQVDRIYASDLKRAFETAQILANGEIEVVPVPGLRERNMGVLENMKRSDAEQLRIKEGKKSLLEFGESGDHLQTRLQEAYLGVIAKAEKDGLKTVVIVSHGSALNNLIMKLMTSGLPFKNAADEAKARRAPRLGNCSLTYIEDGTVTAYGVEWAESIVRQSDLI